MAGEFYCKECEKSFKALTGLNGHNQWKHNKTPDRLVSANPSSKTMIMLEKMTDQIEELKDVIEALQDEIIDLGKDFSRLQSGNGNGNQGNGQNFPDMVGNLVSQTTAPASAPERELMTFFCQNCNGALKFKQAYCPGCGKEIDWSSNPSRYA